MWQVLIGIICNYVTFVDGRWTGVPYSYLHIREVPSMTQNKT
jgi:hypothetical protein